MGGDRKKRYKKKRSMKKTPVDSSSDSDKQISARLVDLYYERERIKRMIKQRKRIVESRLKVLAISSTPSYRDEKFNEHSNYKGSSIQAKNGLHSTGEIGEGYKPTDANRREVRAAMARRSHVPSVIEPDNPEDLDSPDSIEEATLTIQDSTTKSPQKEFWQRSPYTQRLLPADNSPLLIFEVLSARIMPPEGEDLKVKRFVVYELTVRQDSRISIDQLPATIERRYTDFRDLYTCLKRDYPQEMSNIEFPNKVLVGNFSSALIADRADAFELLLTHISRHSVLRSSAIFLNFLQDNELTKACQLLDERNDACIPLLENSFMLLNKIFMDRSKPVLLILCRLVAACTSTPVPHPSAEKWAALALNRYETLCDIDLLPLYIPLLHTCAHLWWQKGRDQKPISDRLTDMSKKGISINNTPTLVQAIHKLDPRSETI